MTRHHKPLEGRRVVVTRAGEQSAELVDRLQALGAQVLLLPLIEFAPPDDPAPLGGAMGKLQEFDWLFLTSQNAVRYVAERAQSISLDLAKKLGPSSLRPRVAAAGEATANAARGHGWRVDRVSGGRGGLDLVRELASELRGCQVLLPRSDRALPHLPRALAGCGAVPTEVVAYRTVPTTNIDPEILGRIEHGEVDALSFASPSAFCALMEGVGLDRLKKMVANVPIAAIGPTTADAIRRCGFRVAIEARVPTAAGLASAIAVHFAGDHAAGTGRSD
jgi:uroporphyrinogen-III synthase